MKKALFATLICLLGTLPAMAQVNDPRILEVKLVFLTGGDEIFLHNDGPYIIECHFGKAEVSEVRVDLSERVGTETSQVVCLESGMIGY